MPLDPDQIGALVKQFPRVLCAARCIGDIRNNGNPKVDAPQVRGNVVQPAFHHASGFDGGHAYTET